MMPAEAINTQTFTIVSPFPEEYVPLFWSWLQEFAYQMQDDYSPQSLEQLQEKNTRDQENGAKSYAIVGEDGQPVGVVWGELLGDGMYMGHLVFDRMLSSSGKLRATRDVLARWFAEGARKICWQSLADNRAFLIFLRRLGASQEGTLRQATRRKGKLVDVSIWATFPEDIQ